MTYKILFKVKEIQIERTCSTKGQIYCIDLEAFNSGVPYADSFTIRTHICVHRETEQSSRILVKAEIVFKKDLWSYIKGKIGKSCLLAYNTHLVQEFSGKLYIYLN